MLCERAQGPCPLHSLSCPMTPPLSQVKMPLPEKLKHPRYRGIKEVRGQQCHHWVDGKVHHAPPIALPHWVIGTAQAPMPQLSFPHVSAALL